MSLFLDLRHKFEKIKLRKLSQDEKKIFFALARNVIEDIFDVGREMNKPSLSPDGSMSQKKKKKKSLTADTKQRSKRSTGSKSPILHMGSVFTESREEKSSRLNPVVVDDVERIGNTPPSSKWGSIDTRKRRRIWGASDNKHTADVNQNVTVNQMAAVNQRAAVNQVDPGASPVARKSGPRRISPPRFKSRSKLVETGTWGSRGDGYVLGRGGEGGYRRHRKNAASGIESRYEHCSQSETVLAICSTL